MSRGALIGMTVVGCLAVISLAPFLGATSIDLRKALDTRIPSATNVDAQILFGARIPRTAAAALVGSGLALSGAVFQAILRNPLADPFTLGIPGGAALGAAIAIRLGLDATAAGGFALGLMAFVGAAAVVALVWALAHRGVMVLPATLLLSGVTLSFLCGAAILLLQHTAPLGTGLRIARWTIGSLDALQGEMLLGILPLWLVGVGTALVLTRALNALAAGVDMAASVGVDVPKVVGVAYVTSSLIVGALVALAGPIGFVGLIVPHVVRALFGPDHRTLLPTCVLFGAAFLVLSDVAARIVLAPVDLPVGIVTALCGAPFFLFLLRRRGGLA